jgi:hypothetical protein
MVFVNYFDRRNLTLACVTYLLSLAALPFNIIAFARLWKLISDLPPGEIRPNQPARREQEKNIWPPAPRS